MTMRLAVIVAAVMFVGGAAIAGNGSCASEMTLEQARDLHESGTVGNCSHARNLVKADIKGCLTFYKPEDCTGPAKQWVQDWGKLEPPSSNIQGSNTNVPPPESFLQKPSFWGVHVPFAKSANDYLAEQSSGFAIGVR